MIEAKPEIPGWRTAERVGAVAGCEPIPTLPAVGDSRTLAGWLLRERVAIEANLRARPAGAFAPEGAEAEALRRFRSFVLAALVGGAAEPALEGLRLAPARAEQLLGGWLDAAAERAVDPAAVRAALAPLCVRFLASLRATSGARRASGAPRNSARRAVPAAIDRVTDAFLAIDAGNGEVADANPAAGALLGVARDRLLGADAFAFFAPDERERWWTELGAVSEGGESRRLEATLVAASGAAVPVEASVTRFATRGRTLALVVARPSATAGSDPAVAPRGAGRTR